MPAVTSKTGSFSKDDLEEALGAIASTIARCEKVQPKLKQGTSQYTLLARRIKALCIASALIQRQLDSMTGDNMEGPLLRDETEYPSDEVLARHLGRAKAAWDAFTDRLLVDVSDGALEWRYYRDGKSWLCKLVRKKKTVCWVSVWDGAFRTTFYFTARSGEEIDRLPIAQQLKDAYRTTSSGKLKPVTIEVRTKKQLGDVFTLIKYRNRGS